VSDPTGEPGYGLADPEFRRIRIALFAAGVATFASLYCTQPLLPTLSAAFSVSPAEAALSVSVTTLGLGIGLLLVGPFSEVHGRTWLIRGSLIASAVVGIACALAPSWPVLLVLRGIEGLTLAGLPAVATAYLREEVSTGAYGRATGLYVGGTAVGGMAGRLVAGALADLGGWRTAVAGVGVLGLLCAVLVVRLLPASRGFHPAPASARHAVRQLGRLLRDPVLLGLYAVGGTLMGAFIAVYNVLGFRLEAPPYGLSVGLAGLVFLVYPLGSVGSVLAGRLVDRFGQRPVVPVCVAVMVLGILLTLARPLPLVVLGVAVMTFGFFAAHAVASGWVAARAAAGAGGAGQAAGIYLLVYYLGSTVAGTLAGSAWTGGGWSRVVTLAVALSAAGGVLTLLLARTQRLSTPPRQPAPLQA
jgi:YNFM family putative membrane transporter